MLGWSSYHLESDAMERAPRLASRGRRDARTPQCTTSRGRPRGRAGATMPRTWVREGGRRSGARAAESGRTRGVVPLSAPRRSAPSFRRRSGGLAVVAVGAARTRCGAVVGGGRLGLGDGAGAVEGGAGGPRREHDTTASAMNQREDDGARGELARGARRSGGLRREGRETGERGRRGNGARPTSLASAERREKTRTRIPRG